MYSFWHILPSGHLGSCPVSAVVYDPACDRGVQDLFEILLAVLLGISPEVDLLDHMVNVFFLLFEKLPFSFPQQLHPMPVPPSSVQGSRFLHILADMCYFLTFSW